MFERMTIEELEARQAAIVTELDDENADLDALEEEARGIKAELEKRKAAEQKKAEIRANVANGAGKTVKKVDKEEREKMTNAEVRASKEYIEAYAKYIKTGKDEECRALLTENVTGGTVPVPTIVEGKIRTAWERNGLMNLVRKTYIKGNVKVGFEVSATGAEVHVEGQPGPQEERLVLGSVTLTPESIKKWIRISDEALDMGGEEFLDYIFDELAYRIAKEAARILVTKITESPAETTSEAPGVKAISGAPSLDIVAKAVANLSDDATNPVVVMNKLTRADFKTAQAQGNYAYDPFEGLEVHYNNDLAAYSAAASGKPWLIVGDFAYGAQANFPNGDEIRIKYDDLTESQDDMIKIVGRQYVGLGVVAPEAFTVVNKAEG